MNRVVAVPVDSAGLVDPRWGKARQVAVAVVGDSGIESWDVVSVGWDELHGQSGEGQHHARVAKFLRDRGVQTVVAGHMGPGMSTMLARMGIEVRLGASGDARAAIVGQRVGGE